MAKDLVQAGPHHVVVNTFLWQVPRYLSAFDNCLSSMQPFVGLDNLCASCGVASE